MEELLQLLHQVHKLTPKLRTHLQGKITRVTFKKGRIIFKAGQVADQILYLEKGLIRSYTLVDGEKASNYFMREGDIIISVESFLTRVPAPDTIEALEDCVCWGITWKELEETYRLFPRFNINGRIITGLYYAKSEARHRARHYKKGVALYEAIMAGDPELLSRVKDSLVASYLNVATSTYSALKKAYQEKLQLSRRKNVRF
jgi:CRP/FNR family transcriptional regulator, anaerobic regulatory protein